jgi:hypothetical protein
MNKKLTHSLLVASLLGTTLLAQEQVQTTEEKRDRIPSVRKAVDSVAKLPQKEVDIIDSFQGMFSDGKVSGQIRTVYASYNNKETNAADTYATAIGGILKYELAQLNGFNAGVAFYTSQDINFATGDAEKHNDELSSQEGSYNQLSEAYINYNYKDFNFRGGRQILETPLADSDDIRMIQNTFDAAIITYNYNDINLLAGYIDRWQGFDAGLDDGWVKAGATYTTLAGISYDEAFELNAWFYNFDELANAYYFDIGGEYNFNKNISLHLGAQYLYESTLNASNYAADIYGALCEVVVYDIGFNLAFNQANKQTAKQSYSGNGGGKLFTSMDTLIVDDIANDRDVTAVVAGVSYTYKKFDFLYAYGDFDGGKNSSVAKAHLSEQDIAFEYAYNDAFTLGGIYVIHQDEHNDQKTEDDWDRMQFLLNYNF